jgi:catechol 2,3-dioxygenase-like lactoylglutathione lyase family enzyme
VRKNLVWCLALLVGGFLMAQPGGAPPMRLGNFSVSLAVKDIAKSREFYEKLGFKVIMGEQEKHWLILQNDSATIGLFQGVFPKNALTFNPGWDRSAKPVADFDDLRTIQKTLKSRGLTLDSAADEASSGPANLILSDPDGNPVVIDQHVPAPKH